MVIFEVHYIWQKALHGVYTPKLGYIALNINFHQRVPCWWWSSLWKLKSPHKAKIFMWSAINDKVPTWDNTRKRHRGWCPIFKQENESIVHILISFPFT
jgi:hypothetical protein